MPTEAKRETVAELAEQLAASRAAIVSDYRGLTVADISALRTSLREQDIAYRVVKNRLMRIAATQADRAELVELLDGPSAIAFGGGDESATARAFVEAVRRYRNVGLRGALLGSQRIDEAGVRRLAALPSREVLLAQLAGAFASPLSVTAGLLSASLRGLGAALRQLEGQRSTTEASSPEAAPAPAEAPTAEASPTEGSPASASPAPAEAAPTAEAAHAEAPPAETPPPEGSTEGASTEAAPAEAPTPEAAPTEGSPAEAASTEGPSAEGSPAEDESATESAAS